MLDSGSSEDKPKVHWFTKSERIYLSKYVCWMCGKLLYCSECKRFECALGFPLSEGACSSRMDAKIVPV